MMPRTLLGFVLATPLAGLCLLAPSLARADEPRETAPSAVVATPASPDLLDAVNTRSGGLIRGRIAEIIPGSHVTILLPNNEARRVPWPDVERVIVASTPSVPPLPAVAPEAPSVPLKGPLVRVHVRSSKQVQLYRKPAGTNSWVHACMSPCDVDLPLGDEYRVNGSGMATSSPVALKGAPGDQIELIVDGASHGGLFLGATVIAGGGLAMLTGYTMVLLSSANTGCYSSCSSDKNLAGAGLVTFVVGVAAAGLGTVIAISSSSTDIEQQNHSAAPPRDAFIREPTWRGSAPATAMRSGSEIVLPLGFSF